MKYLRDFGPLIIFVVVLLIFFANKAEAEQRYNSHTHKWETVQKGEKMTYSPHNRTWQYVKPGTKEEYNSHRRKWEYPH